MQKEHIYIKQQQLCGYNAELSLGLLRIDRYQTTINTHKHTQKNTQLCPGLHDDLQIFVNPARLTVLEN